MLGAGLLGSLLFVSLLPAQIIVTITPPQLQAGMVQLESMLAEQVWNATGQVQSVVNELAEKPDLMQGIADAAGQLGSLPGLAALPGGPGLGFAIGAYAGAQSDTWDPAALGQRLSTIDYALDYALGANLQPLQFQISLGLDFLVPGLDIAAGFGVVDTTVEGITLSHRSVGGGLSLRLFADPAGPAVLRWQGLRINLGVNYLNNQISLPVTTAPIEQSFDLDPDGGGPILPLPVTVRVAPDLVLSLDTWALSVPLGVSTGIEIGNILSINLGAGLGFCFGGTSLGLEGSQEIEVLGFLSGLQRVPGSISLSGQTLAVAPSPVFGQANASLQFRVGGFGITIPVVFSFGSPKTSGLAVGIVAGVKL